MSVCMVVRQIPRGPCSEVPEGSRAAGAHPTDHAEHWPSATQRSTNRQGNRGSLSAVICGSCMRLRSSSLESALAMWLAFVMSAEGPESL